MRLFQLQTLADDGVWHRARTYRSRPAAQVALRRLERGQVIDVSTRAVADAKMGAVTVSFTLPPAPEALQFPTFARS